MRRIIVAIVVFMLIVGSLSATAGIMLSHAAFKLIKPDTQRTHNLSVVMDAKIQDVHR
jgi:hypothetical protein